MYPVNLKLEGKKVLVVGGGKAVLKKIKNIEKADVVILAPEIRDELREKFTCIEDVYRSEYLDGIDLLVIATSDGELNDRIREDAKKRHIWQLSMDDKEKSDLYHISFNKIGDIDIMISTKGRYPEMTGMILEKLEEFKKYDKKTLDEMEKERLKKRDN